MLLELNFLRELSSLSVMLRLTLAALLGGMIGMERGRKRRAAGFRTYMLVCVGAALTMLLGQHEAMLLHTIWRSLAEEIGIRTDVSRFGAQVINGVGFLGAGTIIVTGKQEIKGLTTAAGLWASACMGLAIGAGFYECAVLAFLLIALSMRVLPVIENYIVENSGNMNIYIEFRSLSDIGTIINALKEMDVKIYDVDIERGGENGKYPSAVFSVRLQQKQLHTKVLMAISELQTIRSIEEI